jgi:small ligand-binding sensory domain FIST
MRFHSSVTDQEDSAEAISRAVAETRAALRDRVDLAFVFFTADHRDEADAIAGRVWRDLDPQAVVGCSAEGVIGGDAEIERRPGVAILAASLPGVRLHAFHLRGDDWHDVLEDDDLLRERTGVGSETRATIAFGDPFTTPINQVLAAFDRAGKGIPLIGGMASAARQPGSNVLVRDDAVLVDGMVGVSLSGPVEVETVVSQGCRPIGRPFVVTRAHDNVIDHLGGKPALKVLTETVAELPESERQKLANGLFVGRAINEYRESWGRGDFLVRNVMGVDQDAGSLAVTDYVRVGQTVQFHMRDAATAAEDLSLLLEGQAASNLPAAGALLFSCNGRGTRMFEQPCHDVGAARKAMPRTPVAGFFAAGEFGPVGGKNFIHGHTASFALFRPKTS